MTVLVRLRLDDAAAAALAALRARIPGNSAADRGAGPGPDPRHGPPTVGAPDAQLALTVAAAAAIPPAARAALAAEVRLRALPSITVWLATLAAVGDALVLAAVVDTELLAVHTAVHDTLAGRVRDPVAAHLPGAWVPHVELARRGAVAGFAALHPVAPVRARVVSLEIADLRAGTVHPARP